MRRRRRPSLSRRVRALEEAVFPKGPQWVGPAFTEANVRDSYAALRKRAVRMAMLRVAGDLSERAVELYAEIGSELRAIIGVEQADEFPPGAWELAPYEPARVVGRRMVRQTEGPIVGSG